MPEALAPTVGLSVLHLFCKFKAAARNDVGATRLAIEQALQKFTAEGNQLVTVAMLGHKADLAFMALGTDAWQLRQLQSGLQLAGLDVVDSYVSLTEVSEYAAEMTEGMKRPRLYPEFPIEGMNAWCFYPMSKARGENKNWFALPFEQRKTMMHEHGMSGRKFAGRVQQLVTGSAGLDDFEWGVTLFAVHPDDLKEVVYTMRFDEASALYGQFGAFYTGMVGTMDEVLDAVLNA